ncbi:MmgE/PrpD family protein [Streptomyces sp. 130]|uniref:MmgE/PrpD family protein n=1 Tax=Streptomyces sp. 130 TaxID=2591006 RepID=UPI00163DBBCC|nr:MmgE/PrpD family protein [Streptomyces sp. 130]
MPPDGENFGEAVDAWIDVVADGCDVPAALTTDAAAASADFMLCALIGRTLLGGADRHPGSPPVRPGAVGFPLWWTGRSSTAAHAARANLLAGISADFDSVHYLAGGHLSAFLTPVLFARPDVPLDTALRTQVLATEFAVRLGQAVKDPARANGFHVTPVIGGLATVCALAWRRGLPAERVRWCLRLFLSTYRSDYGLLSSDGRLYQMGQALSQVFAAVDEGGTHTRIDQRAAREWWRPFSAMGVPMDTPAASSQEWLSALGHTSLKSVPCCAYFFETLETVASVRRRVPGDGLRHLHVDVPEYVLAAHRASGSAAWLEPFDLVHNLAICWALDRNYWTPLAELPVEAVRRIAEAITLHPVPDDAAVTVTAVTDDAAVTARAAQRQEPGAALGALRRKAEIVNARLDPEQHRPEVSAGPRQLLRDLLDSCGEDRHGRPPGARQADGVLR